MTHNQNHTWITDDQDKCYGCSCQVEDSLKEVNIKAQQVNCEHSPLDIGDPESPYTVCSKCNKKLKEFYE